MAKIKYNIGDKIGPNGNLLISKERRTTSGGNKKWHGVFQCAVDGCEEVFGADISKVVAGKRCFCREHAKQSIVHECKYHVGDKIGPYEMEILDIDYSNRKNPQGTFQCPIDGTMFQAGLYIVAAGKRSNVCPNCYKLGREPKYRDGDTIGPNGFVLLKRKEDRRIGVFRCGNGHEFEGNIKAAVNGKKRCPECSKLSREITPCRYKIGERLGSRGIELLSVDRHVQGKGWYGTFECPVCGHPFQELISQVANDRRVSCGGHVKDIRKEIARKIIKDITGMRFGRLTALENTGKKSAKTGGSYIWKCICDCQLEKPECEREYTYRPSSYLLSAEKRGQRQSCGCWGKEISTENGKKNAKDITGEVFGYLKALYRDGTVERGTDKIHSATWTCRCLNCNRIAKNVSVADLKSGSRISCGKCFASAGEKRLQDVLDELGLEYESHKTFDECRNPDTNYRLIYDFYIPTLNVLVEYDGVQHYKKDTRMTVESFSAANNRDVFKNEWATQNKIPLIRIPYTSLSDISADFVQDLIDQAASIGENVFVPLSPGTPDERPIKF